jgi:hypothetical protein
VNEDSGSPAAMFTQLQQHWLQYLLSRAQSIFHNSIGCSHMGYETRKLFLYFCHDFALHSGDWTAMYT